jgi:hypothetical protein
MGTTPGAAADGTNKRVGDSQVDPITGCLRQMSNEHAQIHYSNAWEFSLLEETVAQNGTLLVEIRLADAEIHLKEMAVWGDAARAKFEFIEAPTIGTPGTTAIATPNMNRAGAKPAPAGVLLFSDPASISGGTVLLSRFFGGGAGIGQTAFPGAEENDREWILAPNTTYLLRVTNLEANARNFSADGFFYRED